MPAKKRTRKPPGAGPASKKKKAANVEASEMNSADANAAGANPPDSNLPDANPPDVNPPNVNSTDIKSPDVLGNVPQVPVDDRFAEKENYLVFIDDSNLIYDAMLSFSNTNANNNKFYVIQILQSKLAPFQYYTWTRWGRIGEAGAGEALGNGSLDVAIREFEKKFRSKTGLPWDKRESPARAGKYVFLARSYEPDTDEPVVNSGPSPSLVGAPPTEPQESKLPVQVQELMELIFNERYITDAMADLQYDADRLPLGKLSQKTLEEGFQALKELASIIGDDEHIPNRRDTLAQLTNKYYSYIPHDFGRRPPQVITNDRQVRREVEVMESLIDIKIAHDILKASKNANDEEHMLDRYFKGLGVNKLVPLDAKSSTYSELKFYLDNSIGSTHSYRYEVEDIFVVDRGDEITDSYNSFTDLVKSNKSDRRLLWHGSGVTNFVGILSQGLRIAPPEAPVSGYMFDKGIYLADMSSKSAQYCRHYLTANTGILLLCDAELGKDKYECTVSDSNAAYNSGQKNMISTLGSGQVAPKAWKDASCVGLKGVSMPDFRTPAGNTDVSGAVLQYNEYICYNVKQVCIRFLFRVRILGSVY